VYISVKMRRFFSREEGEAKRGRSAYAGRGGGKAGTLCLRGKRGRQSGDASLTREEGEAKRGRFAYAEGEAKEALCLLGCKTETLSFNWH
jgi:hypothetical protein